MTTTADVQSRPAYREVEADLRVAEREVVADGVVTLTLVDPNGEALPKWTPGAHIDLVMGQSLVRQYSLCGSLTDRGTWKVGVLLDPESRGGSRFVHEEIAEGATTRIRGPRNHFPLVDSPRYQFIAGGIGITPILTMIEAAQARRADWQLLYGGRTRASMAFLDLLAQYGDRVTIWPQDEQGHLDLASVLATPGTTRRSTAAAPPACSTRSRRRAGPGPGTACTSSTSPRRRPRPRTTPSSPSTSSASGPE